jgi:hypothetical protein
VRHADNVVLDRAVLEYVKKHPGEGPREIGEAVMRTSCAPRTAARCRIAKALERLEARGWLRHEGDGRGQSPRLWYTQELEQREVESITGGAS